MAVVTSSADGSPESLVCDFGFGFNDVNFSDRIMRIQILPDPFGFKPDPDDSVGDLAPNRKRRRTDTLSNAYTSCSDETEESDENRNRLDLEDVDTDGNLEAVIKDNEPLSSTEYSGGVRVRNLHINSLILAAKSPFFHKLFTNGMKESRQRQVTLQIQASEEDAVLDLLKYMYSNKLPRAATPKALLNVLMAADKFEVLSCMRYSAQLLCSLPMSVESALVYLDYPSMADTIQQLTKAAKQFLVDHFKDLSKDLSKFKEEVLKLSLAGIETVLSSDDLQVASEDDIYEIVVKWAQSHYPKIEERRDVLRKLIQLVRFPFMSYSKLKQVLVSGDIDPELVSKSVTDALFFKAKCINNSHYAERRYTSPLKVVQLESPWQQCIVYWDLKREECLQLLLKREMQSCKFNLGGQGFYLAAFYCNMNQEISICFRLLMDEAEKQPPPRFIVDCEFAVRVLPNKDFKVKSRGKVQSRISNLFKTSWSAFMENDSSYFINGVVHLKLDLALDK